MTKSLADELVTLLDEAISENYFSYTVKAVNRRPHLETDNPVSWEVQLSPTHKYVPYIRTMIKLAQTVDEQVMVSVAIEDGGYIVFL